jgi:hypothetical protein
MAIDPQSIMLASTAGVTPSSNGVATDATLTLVSDSEKSCVCLATGSVVFISSGDAFTVAWAEQVLTRAPVPTDDDDSDAEATSDTGGSEFSAVPVANDRSRQHRCRSTWGLVSRSNGSI